MELKIRPTPLTDSLLRGDDAAFNFCAFKMLDHARQMERERAYLMEKEASNRATMDTLKEQLKADEKAAYDLRCLLHEVADHCGISAALWPSAVADRLKQMKDDKDEIETMWEELTKAIGAHGVESDPLTGSDTNDTIHQRAMENLKGLGTALRGLLEAEEATVEDFNAKEIDGLESAMNQARHALEILGQNGESGATRKG